MTDITVTRGSLPADRFTIVENDMVRGKLPVPIKAMGRCILLHLLSLPSGWKMTRTDIDRAFLEGRDAVTAGLRDLTRAGYLLATRTSGPGGHWQWTYQVTDNPIERPITPHHAPSRPITIYGNPVDGPDLRKHHRSPGRTIYGFTIDGQAVDKRRRPTRPEDY